ncbi:MAG: hypothetical protein A3H35_07855 [Betaproteobacteria bacterium RIFCSPLOWO2_02_FULL_62_17]|nr:MAG: hypothetical protein A3H35_07855 [Betaproteobacteria bacterium RIFCSPLOWO2_02_FULL_62_17]
MTFVESTSICLNKYTDFKGRASRSEYWWFFLFCVLLQLVGAAVHEALGGLLALALLLPSLSAAARRLHDVDRGGWWMLVGLIPIIGFLILLFWMVQPGTQSANEFGEPLAA